MPIVIPFWTLYLLSKQTGKCCILFSSCSENGVILKNKNTSPRWCQQCRHLITRNAVCLNIYYSSTWIQLVVKKIKNVNAQINFIHSSVFCDYFFFNLELITTLWTFFLKPFFSIIAIRDDKHLYQRNVRRINCTLWNMILTAFSEGIRYQNNTFFIYRFWNHRY